MRIQSIVPAIVIAGTILFAPTGAIAQTPALTLADAVRYALAHNPTVAQQVAALTQAQNALAKQEGQTFPIVSAQVQSQLNKVSPSYGGSFQIIGAQQPQVYSQNTAQIYTQYQLNAGGLGLLQLGEAKAQVDQAAANLKRTREQIAATVTAAFYGIAQKNAIVSIDSSDLGYQTILLQNAQAKEKAGVAAGVDVLRAQVAQEKSKSTLVADKASVLNAQESLAQSIGAPVESAFALPQVIAQPDLPKGSVETLISIAQNTRPDIRSAEFGVRNAQLARKGFDRELFPQLQISGSFGNQFSPTNTALLPPNTPRGVPGYWALGVTTTFTLPLVDYGARHTERANDDAAIASAQATLDAAKGQVEIDVRQNYRAALTAQAQLAYAQDESRLGIEAARIAQLQYQNGIIALSDVAQAEQTSVTAQSDLINARVNYVNAIVNLRVALGTYDAESAVAGL
ncbi:MAG TPA: TolC family protein [Candidatus Baltobacteraceae bacterium]